MHFFLNYLVIYMIKVQTHTNSYVSTINNSLHHQQNVLSSCQ